MAASAIRMPWPVRRAGGMDGAIISFLVCEAVAAVFLVASEPCRHWFVVPLILCGTSSAAMPSTGFADASGCSTPSESSASWACTSSFSRRSCTCTGMPGPSPSPLLPPNGATGSATWPPSTSSASWRIAPPATHWPAAPTRQTFHLETAKAALYLRHGVRPDATFLRRFTFMPLSAASPATSTPT